MRQYVFTNVEREILETYLNSGVKLQDFRILMYRIKKNHELLKNDLKLVDAVLKKLTHVSDYQHDDHKQS
jgi:hypothetical protein